MAQATDQPARISHVLREHFRMVYSLAAPRLFGAQGITPSKLGQTVIDGDACWVHKHRTADVAAETCRPQEAKLLARTGWCARCHGRHVALNPYHDLPN